MILLDSSAWLAHLFGEAGAEEVTQLFAEVDAQVAISVLSMVEVYGRLKALNAESHWPEVWATYQLLFTATLAADEAVAQQAIALRAATDARLPTIDGIIAATAVQHNLTLVHRDAHFAAIPANLLKQRLLAEK